MTTIFALAVIVTAVMAAWTEWAAFYWLSGLFAAGFALSFVHWLVVRPAREPQPRGAHRR